MKKRFLCIMLVLLMASALLPAGAFAAEGGKGLAPGHGRIYSLHRGKRQPAAAAIAGAALTGNIVLLAVA